jgi:O-methyltransferase domain
VLEPNGRILIIEDILPDKVDGIMSLIEADLTMLVCHNGQERTLAEYEELLVREGFRLESVGETSSFDNLIEASAAPNSLSPPAYTIDHPCPTKGAAIQSHDDEDQTTLQRGTLGARQERYGEDELR